MLRQLEQGAPAWRLRREEYLRASGRRASLVKEGYDPEGVSGWSVITGGRPPGPPKSTSGVRLLLVK
jgi:hypothetical protein